MYCSRQIIYVRSIGFLLIAVCNRLVLRFFMFGSIVSFGLTGCAEGPKQDVDLNIAIIGAGAAGLTAAHTLRKKGYNNITIFEKEPQVGGKVSSFNYKGTTVEMGAIMTDETDYPIVLSLAEEYDVEHEVFFNSLELEPGLKPIIEKIMARANSCFYITSHGDCDDYDINPLEIVVWITDSIVNNFWIIPPGFDKAPKSSYIDMETYLRQRNISSTQYVSKYFATAYGFGYYEDVPAMYYLKYLSMINDLQMKLGYFPEGWQSLWIKLADSLDVRLNSSVTEVVRRETDEGIKIDITVNNDPTTLEEFDRVIIASPLQNTDTFLDQTEIERDLFERIDSYNYVVSLVKLKSALPLPIDSPLCINYEPSFECMGITIWGNLDSARLGHVMEIFNVNDEDHVYAVHQLNDWSLSEGDIYLKLLEDFELLGVEVDTEFQRGGIIHQKSWDYFPHVKSQDLDAGFYQKLESLQGRNGTYYVGGIMNFETVERTAQYSKHLMKSYF